MFPISKWDNENFIDINERKKKKKNRTYVSEMKKKSGL